MGRGARRRSCGPRVLLEVYRSDLQTFQELLIVLLREAQCESLGASAKLIEVGDSEAYISLLQCSYAAMPETAPALGSVPLSQEWPQKEIVHEIIRKKFGQETKPSHVLCAGYSTKRQSSRDCNPRQAPRGLDCNVENSAVEIVTSRHWNTLLSRVGDSVMRHVLSHAAVFVSLPNGCYQQILGTPIKDTIAAVRQSRSLQPPETSLSQYIPNDLKTRARKSQKQGQTQVCSVLDICEAKHGCSSETSTLDPESEQIGTSSRAPPPCVHREDAQFGDSPSKIYSRKRCIEHCHAGEELPRKKMRHPFSHPSSKNARELESRKTLFGAELVALSLTSAEPNVSTASTTDTHRGSCPTSKRRGSSEPNDGLSSRSIINKNSEVSNLPIKEKLSTNADANRRLSILQNSSGVNEKVAARTGPGKLQGSVQESRKKSDVLKDYSDVPKTSYITGGSEAKKKRTRPSKWKRKILQRARECRNASTAPGNDSESKDIGARRDTQGSCDKAGTLAFKPGPHQPQTRDKSVTNFELEPGQENGGTKERHFKGMQDRSRRPSSANSAVRAGRELKQITRGPMFYNSSFRSRPGLVSTHILNTLKPNDAGAGALFSAIFGTDCSCGTANDMLCHAKSVGTLLKAMISRTKLCAFGRLLHRHCPLPPDFHSDRTDSSPVSSTARKRQRRGPKDKESHEMEQQDVESRGLASEVEKILSILLPLSSQETMIQAQETAGHDSRSRTNPTKKHDVGFETCEGRIGVDTATSEAGKKRKVSQDHDVDRRKNGKAQQADTTSSCVSHSAVVGFLFAVCRSIIPEEMLGSQKSWRTLRRSMFQFVNLRRREAFTAQDLLYKQKVLDFCWLKFKCTCQLGELSRQASVSRSENLEVQKKRLQLWLYWLFTNFLVPLIRAHFYVTETENHRQDIFYYRKSVWAKYKAAAVKELTAQKYKKVSSHAAAQTFSLKGRQLGFAPMRLLPKRTGLRPLANLSAPSYCTLKVWKPSNVQCGSRQKFGVTPTEMSLCLRKDFRQGIGSVRSDPEDVMALFRRPFGDYSELTPHTSLSPERFSNSSRIARTESSRLSTAKLAFKPKDLRGPRKKEPKTFSFRSINLSLQSVHSCLLIEKESRLDQFGSSVFFYSDVYERILPFILDLKRTGMPQLYIAVCDVSKAFETILQDKLQDIVENFFQSSKYNVTQYTRVIPTLALPQAAVKRACARGGQPHKFADLVGNLAVKRAHSIFIDQAFSESVLREKMVKLLKEHISQNLVRIGNAFYKQIVGIPQGSTVSSLLCSLFYGHFDNHWLLPKLQFSVSEKTTQNSGMSTTLSQETVVLCSSLTTPVVYGRDVLKDGHAGQKLESSLDISEPTQERLWTTQVSQRVCVDAEGSSSSLFELIHQELDDAGASFSSTQDHEVAGSDGQDSVLLRMIDDSLFISTSELKARTFVEVMHTGSREYGCQVNGNKSATNFHYEQSINSSLKNLYKTGDGACFIRWNGILFNCHTMEIQADYTRYCGEHIRSTLKVQREYNQGRELARHLCYYMRPKCHVMFYDPRINSPSTIRLNVFQASLLCAMKFHAYVSSLPKVACCNQMFLFRAISGAIRYMCYGLVQKRMKTLRDAGAGSGACLSDEEIHWLGYTAFHRVLNRKQGRYPLLLHKLQGRLQLPEYESMSTTPELASAIDTKRSSMFDFIIY